VQALLGRDTGTVAPVATWRTVLALALSLAGLAVSVYLTIAHYGGSHVLVCTDSGAINCEKVTTSPQSIVLGIPVAVLGLGFYVVMTALNLPRAWRSQDRRIHAARLGLAVVGMGFALYLISAELLVIKAICLWCTTVHVITFALLVLLMSTVPTMLGWGRRDD
jgi:uncharacterized membrane protein